MKYLRQTSHWGSLSNTAARSYDIHYSVTFGGCCKTPPSSKGVTSWHHQRRHHASKGFRQYQMYSAGQCGESAISQVTVNDKNVIFIIIILCDSAQRYRKTNSHTNSLGLSLSLSISPSSPPPPLSLSLSHTHTHTHTHTQTHLPHPCLTALS